MPESPVTLEDLRKQLDQQSIRQHQIAQRLGLSESWLSKILKGRVSTPKSFVGQCLVAIRQIQMERDARR